MLTFEQAIQAVAVAAVIAVIGGFLLAMWLRVFGLRWTWALLGIPAALPFFGGQLLIWPVWAACLFACSLGLGWHRHDLDSGADLAEMARERLGMLGALRRAKRRRAVRLRGFIHDGRLVLGQDRRGIPVTMPVGYRSGMHTLVVSSARVADTTRSLA